SFEPRTTNHEPRTSPLRYRLARLVPGFKLLERPAQPHRLRQPVRDHFRGLVAIPRHADDNRLVARNGPAADQIDRGGESRTAGGFGEDPFGFREQPDGFDDLLVGDGGTGSPGRFHPLAHLIAVAWIADPTRLGEG